ncbi:MAG: nucleoside phosphorylase [Desulfosarcinaceae bacterium]|nr:nucleoside phosphorylase [Desulfosarcinaceae bacterium]
MTAQDGIPAEMGIVQPVRSAKTPVLQRRVLLAAAQADAAYLAQRVAPHVTHSRQLYTSRLIQTASERGTLSVVGPLMGAPYAVMLMETLVAWGAREFCFLGWCGAIQREIAVGDLLWVTEAHIDEGTSPSYGQRWQGRVRAPAHGLGHRADRVLRDDGLPALKGAVWTTDAIFRETPAKVKRFRAAGALAVEMEVSALYAAAEFHEISCLALLTVSDRVVDNIWQPGFKTEIFQTNRRRHCEAALRICLEEDP